MTDDDIDYSILSGMTKDELIDWLFAKGISADYNQPMTRDQIKRMGEKSIRRCYNNIIATHNLVSIVNAKGGDLGIEETNKYCYVLTYSFPCVLPGTKIDTSDGYKNIEDVKVGDYVLTHKNRYRMVTKTMCKMSDHYNSVRAVGSYGLKITDDHPMYVLKGGELEWTPVRNLSKDCKISLNINQESEEYEKPELLWLIGRYVADGFINKYLYNSVLFAIGGSKEEDFKNHIPSDMLNRFKRFQKSCAEYRIADKPLKEICEQFGTGAKNKKIPNWVFSLKKEHLQMFFDGYMSGDGHVRKRGSSKEYMFCTVSEELALGLQKIIAKLYGRVCSFYLRKDKRKDTFNDTYNGLFTVSSKENSSTSCQEMHGDKACGTFRRVERTERSTLVYNLEVEEDNSYTANNIIIHNCQDLSLAGLGKGMSEGSGTRSGMLWEVRRLLEETPNLPQILLMENVTQVHGTKNVDDFLKWQAFLNSLGYKSYWLDMNAKDYGVPQNRDRCFMVSFLGDYYYDFPHPFKLEKRLKDLLEPEVDEKYYLSQEALNGFVVHKQKQEEQGNSFHAIIKNPDQDESASTIKARYYKDGSDCLIEEEVPRRICNIYGDKFGTGYAGNVWDKEGLCPALMTMEGGNRQPMVLDEPREAEVIGGIGEMKSNGGTQFFQQDIVYEGDIALSHPASLLSGSYMYAVDEPFVCASRGRNEENPSDRTKGIELHQRLEPNYSGCSNTLTSVDKDNYVVIPQMESELVQNAYERFAEKNGYVPDMFNAYNETEITDVAPAQQTSAEYSTSSSAVLILKGLIEVYDENGVVHYMRVRKLTPRECGRLMGVRDEDITRMSKNQSDSSLYHLFGDSICVDCLMEIFKMML